VAVGVGVGVGVAVVVGVGVGVGVGVAPPPGPRVGVGVGAAAHPAKVNADRSVIVTFVVARARPRRLPPVSVMAPPERMVPRTIERVIVASAAVRQYTLHACPPEPTAKAMLKSINVSAPLDVRAPTLKTQTSLALPLSVRMTPAPSVVPTAER
jgi:hypothetical protein